MSASYREVDGPVLCVYGAGPWDGPVLCTVCRAVGWACSVYYEGPWDGPVLWTVLGRRMDLYSVLFAGLWHGPVLYSVYGGLYIGPRACRDLEIMPLSPYILYI